jgi:YggT family protein
MGPIFSLIDTLLYLYGFCLLASVIASWLIQFNILNGSNPNVRQILYALRRITEPLLAPIRRLLPDLGGLDISPIIVFLAIQFLRSEIVVLSRYVL